MKLQAIADQVIIEPHEKKSQTSGGVILPDIAKEDTVTGRVISVGPGTINYYGKYNQMHCKIDDEVLYPKNMVRTITFEDTELLVIRENDICAIITK